MLDACPSEHLEVPQFLARLQALLPELDEVYAVAEHLVKEAREIASALPGIGTEIQPGRGQPVTQLDVPAV